MNHTLDLKNLFFLLLILVFGRSTMAQVITSSAYPLGVNESLNVSGANREQIEKVLLFYSKKESDSLKLKSAFFLIDNMKWHKSNYKSILVDRNFEGIVGYADAMYFDLVKGKTSVEISSKVIKDDIQKIKKTVQDSLKKLVFREPEILGTGAMVSDLNTISADFLIAHIDNAFEMRESSPFVRKLPFADFCEFVLPYRMLDGYNFRHSGKELRNFFGKYLGVLNEAGFSENVALYNLTVNNLRSILGQYPLEERTGFEELFFSKVSGFDCFSISNYGNCVLNACGIPVGINYNIAYKMLRGTHSMCTIPTSISDLTSFSPESSVPVLKNSDNKQQEGTMNLFQIHFSVQKGNPYFLRNAQANEFVPENLADPLIEDVTSKYIPTTSLSLYFDKPTQNHLAYLETFNSAYGSVPVCWGTIDKSKKTIDFKNVVLDRLYFPVYYEKDNKLSFSKAFYLTADHRNRKGYRVVYPFKETKDKKKIDLVLNSKFPVKPKMKDLADNLIGTVVVGFNSSREKKDTLYTLNYSPGPYLQDISLKNARAYKNYRIEAPKTFPKMNISELQFLTLKTFGYINICEPSPLPVFSPKLIGQQDSSMIRVLQSDINKLSSWPEYDGNMETAPSAYPYVTLSLKEPQVITTVRFAPLNSNNGIVPGNEYLLYYWEDGRWNLFGNSQLATFNYIEFQNVPRNKMYWLKNATAGKEELPFIIGKNNKQVFFYSGEKMF